MNKSTQQFTTIDEYTKTFPMNIQTLLNELRQFIKSVVPAAEEVISYQMPTFKLNGKNLVYFAAFKKHIGFYPFPSGVAAFKKETDDYVTSKGGIQFPFDKPIPYDLVKKVIEFRAKENL